MVDALDFSDLGEGNVVFGCSLERLGNSRGRWLEDTTWDALVLTLEKNKLA